jgi:hypothetical protein
MRNTWNSIHSFTRAKRQLLRLVSSLALLIC